MSDLVEVKSKKQLNARIGTYDLAIQADEQDSLRLDGDGRWASFRSGRSFFRRLLDASVLVHRDGQRLLRSAQARVVHERAHAFAGKLLKSVQTARTELRLSGDLPCLDALRSRLELAARWSPDDYVRQATQYRAAYPQDIQILPPDRYLDLVLMPSFGCPAANCGFCAFYRDDPFRIASRSEFAEHLLAVKELFGTSIRLRDGLFLGSANALAIPQRRLLEVLDECRLVFGETRRGIAAFWDPDHCTRRTLADWKDLALAGLCRVYAGLETGDAVLRAQLGKSSDVEAFTSAVRTCKQAGLGLGVILLVGPGGLDKAYEHRARTVDAIASMALSASDLVYLSPLRGSMSPGLLLGEQQLLATELRAVTRAKTASYCMEQFHYFA